MIDEEILRDKLTEAASGQDELLPRALSDDLAAGRRRLRRHQWAAGGGAVIAATVVGGLTLGLTSWLGPDTGGSPAVGPAGVVTPAVTRAVSPTANRTQSPPVLVSPGRSTDPIAPVQPPTGARLAQDKAWDRLMRKILSERVDPAKRHLDYSSGGFTVDRQAGVRSVGGRIGWRMPGQRGQGFIMLGVASSAKASSARCGSELIVPAVTCRTVRLANGRTAQLGRRGDAAEVTYVQPDGEYVAVTVSPLFRNNTEIPVHDLGITDAELLALVQDERLELPPLTDREQATENRFKGYKPSPQAIQAAATRHLAGGVLKHERTEDVPEQLGVTSTWRSGAVRQNVEVGLDSSAAVSPCQDQLGVPCQTETLPDGKQVMFGGDVATGQYGAMFVQPDGDASWARVYPDRGVAGRSQNGITKQQLMALVTDPALDK